MINSKHHRQAGFTIIELMIATAVLSIILVLATVVMVNIGSLYYKGINQARVQDDVRSITDEATRYIQLNDQPPTSLVNGPNNTQLICIGPVRYAYVLGVQIGHPAPGSPDTYHQVLWRDNNPTPGSCPIPVDPSDSSKGNVDLTRTDLAAADPTGTELIAANSRLTQFSMITLTPASPTTVSVGVAYGDDDLLCNPTAIPTSCSTSNAMPTQANYSGNAGDVICKGGKGDQFCSTAYLTTSAVGRIAGGSF
jgi:prepilin-type N-terminal cleavage/methylation domain-containing protein